MSDRVTILPSYRKNRVSHNLEAVRAKTTGAELIAVSKTHGMDAIIPVLEAGQRIFGENRVQEAADKWPELREKYDDITLHLIGPLQTNKARQAVKLFDVIQTLDRPKLARTLVRVFEEENKRPNCFIQVNIGAEEQKAGIGPAEADDFIKLCRDELGLPVKGLMCIPPAGEDPVPHFQQMREIAERNGLENLSMGMSGDYEVAIREGATHVRVGTAIFGSRA